MRQSRWEEEGGAYVTQRWTGGEGEEGVSGRARWYVAVISNRCRKAGVRV